MPATGRSETLPEVFDKVWYTAKDKISPPELETIHFTKEKHGELKAQADKVTSYEDLSLLINSFLNSLHISHTQFYTRHDLDFFFLKSMFGAREITHPKLYHIGAQFVRDEQGFYPVKVVLDNYPADQTKL